MTTYLNKRAQARRLELAGMKRTLVEIDKDLLDHKVYVSESKGALTKFFSKSLNCQKSRIDEFKQILIDEIELRSAQK